MALFSRESVSRVWQAITFGRLKTTPLQNIAPDAETMSGSAVPASELLRELRESLGLSSAQAIDRSPQVDEPAPLDAGTIARVTAESVAVQREVLERVNRTLAPRGLRRRIAMR